MFRRLLVLLFVAPLATIAFAAERPRSLHDPTSYPLVWREPGVEGVVETLGTVYQRSGGRDLRVDRYSPRGEPIEGGRAAVLFVSGAGDDPSRPLKDWEIYRTWMRTLAARGYVALMGETEPGAVGASLEKLLGWLRAQARELGVDPGRIGIWACSGNVPAALDLALGASGIRSAALLYGAGEPERIRPDLPVLLLVAGRDAPTLVAAERALARRAIEAAAPWTVVEAPALPHAFDAFDRSPESLAAVRQVLAFLDATLQPVPEPGPESAEQQSAREAIGQLYAREWKAAHDYYNELADEGANEDVHVWLNLAWARRGLGSAVGELVALEQAVRVAPDDLRLRRRWTRLAGHLNSWETVELGLGPLAGSDALDADDLGLLGLARLRLGRAAEAVAPLERGVALGAEPAVRYNLACALALTGEPELALDALEAAVEAGFGDRESVERDADLESLRPDPRFGAILGKLPARENAELP